MFFVILMQVLMSAQIFGAACDAGYLQNVVGSEYSEVYIVTQEEGARPMSLLAYRMSVFLIHKKVDYLPLTLDMTKEDCGLVALLKVSPSDICLCYVPSNIDGYERIQAVKAKSRACWVDELPVMKAFDEIVERHFK